MRSWCQVDRARARQVRRSSAVVASMFALVSLSCAGPPTAAASGAAHPRFEIPASADQLIVVSSPTYDPSDYLATFQSFRRANASSSWERVFPAWQSEIGSGHIVDVRREGDHATPTGCTRSASRCTGPGPIPEGCTSPTTSSCAATGGTRTPTRPGTTGSCTWPAGRHQRSRPGPSRCGPRPGVTGAIRTSRLSTTTTTRPSPGRMPPARGSPARLDGRTYRGMHRPSGHRPAEGAALARAFKAPGHRDRHQRRSRPSSTRTRLAVLANRRAAPVRPGSASRHDFTYGWPSPSAPGSCPRILQPRRWSRRRGA